MTWHFPPHMPEPDAHIIALYKGCKIGNYFELVIREYEGLGHIEKWCYYGDFKETLERKRRDAIVS